MAQYWNKYCREEKERAEERDYNGAPRAKLRAETMNV